MKLLLASKSPRRQQILKDMGIAYELVYLDADESFGSMEPENVAEYLAVKKSKEYAALAEGEILLTADTTVLLKGEIINKPENRDHAIEMIERLSGNVHQVVTGVCLRTKEQLVSFSEITLVKFNEIGSKEIEYYVDTYQPFDKAGAYGIQEWIGLSHIQSIHGSYFNVMGLPSHRVYEELLKLGYNY